MHRNTYAQLATIRRVSERHRLSLLREIWPRHSSFILLLWIDSFQDHCFFSIFWYFTWFSILHKALEIHLFIFIILIVFLTIACLSFKAHSRSTYSYTQENIWTALIMICVLQYYSTLLWWRCTIEMTFLKMLIVTHTFTLVIFFKNILSSF